ncbi:MAG: response regulator transcription factor [Rubrobacter sp.]|nr:response regulator transcription factor [Rubrobacter sp.]
MARLVIVDDHDLFRSGLRTILLMEPDFEVVGEARNGREGVEMCRFLCPDLVLMDVHMPGMDGLEAAREIRRQNLPASVMMVTAHDDEDYLMEALKAGASGYILKHAPPSQISTAVRKALEGEFPLNRDLTTRLLRRLAHEMRESEGSRLPEKPTSPLTAREIEVLRLLAKGNTNRDIARELVISLGTAKNHVQHIIAKLEVADRTQAAVKAIELRLL